MLRNIATVEPLYNSHIGNGTKWPLQKVAVVEFLNKGQCMDFLSAGMKKGGHCREVAVSRGSTVFHFFESILP